MKSELSAIASAILMILALAISLYIFFPELGITITTSLFLLSSFLTVVFAVAGKKSFLIIVLAAIVFGYINILSSGVILIASVLSASLLVIVKMATGIVGNCQGKWYENGVRSPKQVNLSRRYNHDPIEAYSAGGLPIEYNDGSKIDINPARSIDDLM